jgi:FkbM family methyltransferase
MGIEKIKNYFTPNSVLDIGANVGQFYNEIKQIFPNSYYYLIEGNERCEIVLQSLGVDYSIALLSDKVKEVKFYTRTNEERCTGNSIYREKTPFFSDDEITIKNETTTTLDILIKDKRFDLIKIDVQGSELDIINGGLEIIKNSKGVLMEVSLTEYNENAPTKEFVYEFMEKLNFYPAEIIGDINHPITYQLIQQDILFIKNS